MNQECPLPAFPFWGLISGMQVPKLIRSNDDFPHELELTVLQATTWREAVQEVRDRSTVPLAPLSDFT